VTGGDAAVAYVVSPPGGPRTWRDNDGGRDDDGGRAQGVPGYLEVKEGASNLAHAALFTLVK
jgi:hypothetical protein